MCSHYFMNPAAITLWIQDSYHSIFTFQVSYFIYFKNSIIYFKNSKKSAAKLHLEAGCRILKIYFKNDNFLKCEAQLILLNKVKIFLSVAKDLANHWTDIVLFYSKDLYKSWNSFRLFYFYKVWVWFYAIFLLFYILSNT